MATAPRTWQRAGCLTNILKYDRVLTCRCIGIQVYLGSGKGAQFFMNKNIAWLMVWLCLGLSRVFAALPVNMIGIQQISATRAEVSYNKGTFTGSLRLERTSSLGTPDQPAVYQPLTSGQVVGVRFQGPIVIWTLDLTKFGGQCYFRVAQL